MQQLLVIQDSRSTEDGNIVMVGGGMEFVKSLAAISEQLYGKDDKTTLLNKWRAADIVLAISTHPGRSQHLPAKLLKGRDGDWLELEAEQVMI